MTGYHGAVRNSVRCHDANAMSLHPPSAPPVITIDRSHRSKTHHAGKIVVKALTQRGIRHLGCHVCKQAPCPLDHSIGDALSEQRTPHMPVSLHSKSRAGHSRAVFSALQARYVSAWTQLSATTCRLSSAPAIQHCPADEAPYPPCSFQPSQKFIWQPSH